MSAKLKIHPTAVVDDGAAIGEGSAIWHFCHVSGGSRIGRNCSLGQNVFVGPKAVIGDGVRIQNNVSIYDGVILEDEVFCGPSMVFTNVNTPRAHVSRKNDYAETRVGRRVTIGANATIVCGHEIGAYAFIGAGAVITKDVIEHAVMAGNPARRIGWACRCGEMLREKNGTLYCERCKSSYQQSADGLSYLEQGE